MKRLIITTLAVFALLYSFVCMAMYFNQELLIFHPSSLSQNYHFQFDQSFEEMHFKMQDKTRLNGVLFKTDSASKGLIFYLHGNAGNVQSWGRLADTYTSRNYDVFFVDYRGFGKSEGVIENEFVLLHDMQTVYDSIKTRYYEENIIILGYSIGTGLAAYLASENHPKKLILQAPYFSLCDLSKNIFPFLPSFLVNYSIRTDLFIPKSTCPINIFHGLDDETIYFDSSKKLRSLDSARISLVPLQNQGHNNITENQVYLKELDKILGN